mgnify:FL=1|tara:strand:- start:14451 stop:16067 length:1617 start_codon:yes stop_codon:yes gene_type:complete
MFAMMDAMKAKAEKPTVVAPPRKMTESLQLQDQADALTRRIELERRRGIDLETQIKKTKAKIDEQRLKMGGVDAAREDSVKTARQIKILENRLDKALVKHNEALARNKKLRLTVDDLRKERLVFDDIYDKLLTELEDKKTEMGAVVEISNKAFEARDRAVHEMARLKTTANKEQHAFEVEFAELGRQIQNDKRMKEFLKHKADDSEAQAQAISAAAAEKEKEKNKRSLRNKWSFAKDRVSQGITAEKVKSYSAAFATIAEFTGESDVEKLVEQFVVAENENFRLFSYVNSLNSEIEKLDEQIVELNEEIAKCKGEGSASAEERAKALQKLEKRLKTAEQKSNTYDQKYKEATLTLHLLKDGAWRMYNKIGCNTPSNRELLGDEGVTENNVMQYLGVVEQRTNEILQMFAASQANMASANANANGNDPSKALLTAGPTIAPTTTPTTLQIEPPSTTAPKHDDTDSDEEDDERPLTRDEIRVKMLQALKKREASGDEKVDEKKVSDKKTMKKGTVPMGTSKTVSSKTLTKTNLGRGKENK